jgi:ATP-dependent Lon protease
VIIPEKNRKELSEIPKNIRRKLKFIPVSHMDEVLPIAFSEDPTKTAT